jgi:predicted nuclease of predicted toxin-antitoxin system
VNILVDENMPRSLAAAISALGFQADDVRDMGLRARPDTEVMQLAIELDAIIITRDRPTRKGHPLWVIRLWPTRRRLRPSTSW